MPSLKKQCAGWWEAALSPFPNHSLVTQYPQPCQPLLSRRLCPAYTCMVTCACSARLPGRSNLLETKGKR